MAVLAGAVASPASAGDGNGGQAAAKTKVAKATVKIKPFGLRGGRARIMSKVTIGGNIKPYSPGQRVRPIKHLFCLVLSSPGLIAAGYACLSTQQEHMKRFPRRV